MSKIFITYKSPVLELLLDEWDDALCANHNWFAKLFKTQAYRDRCTRIAEMKKAARKYLLATLPPGANGWISHQPGSDVWVLDTSAGETKAPSYHGRGVNGGIYGCN